MNSKIVLVGKAAAGKDFMRKRMMDKGFKFGISCTTRPMRRGEVDGKDYYFLTREEFEAKIKEGQFVEHQEFNGWLYGITTEEFDRCDVLILNVEAVNILPQEIRDRCFVIYLDIPLEIRYERMKVRNDADMIDRRIEADEVQYVGFDNYDCRISNHDF